MDLAGKYDKSNLLGDGEVQVWRGRERSRGTPVLLHTFTGSPRVLRLAVEYLLTRPPSSPLLEIGEWEGATCLVTASELELLDINAWLQNAITVSRTAPAHQAPPERMEQRVNTTGPVPMPRVDSEPITKPESSPNPAPQAPGEFTRAFQIPSSNVPPQRLPDPLASSGPAKAPTGPGEFTQLFQLPAQTGNRETAKASELTMRPSPPDIHPPAAPPSAGEFTRLFRTQPNADSPRDFPLAGGGSKQTFPSPELAAEPVAPRLRVASAPVPLPEHSEPPVQRGPGEYTRVMQTPSLPTPTRQPSVAPSPASAQAVHLPVPAGVFPAMPSVPAPPTLAPPPMPSVPASIPAPAGARPGISPVVLLLGGLILVAIILVLIFALRR
jgi:hypothetical protein